MNQSAALAGLLRDRNSDFRAVRKAQFQGSPMLIVCSGAFGRSAVAVSDRRLLRARLDFDSQVLYSRTASSASRWRRIASAPNQQFLDANSYSAFIGGFFDNTGRGREMQMTDVDRRAKEGPFRKLTVSRHFNAALCNYRFT